MIGLSNSDERANPFAYRIQGTKHAPIVHLVGDVDLAAVTTLAAVGAKLVADKRSAVLRVDCREMTFFDCSALRAVLELDEQASARGKAVCWRHVPECMRRVLQLTRTTTSLALVD